MIQKFQDNIDRYNRQHEQLNRKDKRLSLFRFGLFAVCATTIVYAVNVNNGYLLSIIVLAFVISFGLLIKIHNNIKYENDLSFHLKKLNQEEIKRCENDFSELNGANKFHDKQHFYSPDLDLFGSNSLFQLIVRSRLIQTQNLAALWMQIPASREVVIRRQEAIKELSSKTDWRQNFSSNGMYAAHTQTENQLQSFQEWMTDSDDFIEKPIWKVLGWAMPVISLSLLVGIFFFGLPYQFLFVPVIVNMYLLWVISNPLKRLTKHFDKASKSLKMYSRLFEAIECTDFSSDRLKELKGKLQNADTIASKRIAQLGRILDQLENRVNWFYMSLNVLFVLDFIWLRQGEKWKRKNREVSKGWFKVVHEFDLLSDMASFAFANPTYVFPKITDLPFELKTVELGHPLIKAGSRVPNSFEFKEKGFVGLITGSNMSGKSTFLRTVGLGLTMAQMGLPVCARSFNFSSTRIFTSMRTTDNLEESVSSFYAELARIKALLDAINDEEPMLFLLDEILKGTNSEDRNKGSIALIKQLSEKNAFGLISTHDLSLSSLEGENKLIKNYSFNSSIKGDEILFDYKLTNGPCHSFNASNLMEKMGIIPN